MPLQPTHLKSYIRRARCSRTQAAWSEYPSQLTSGWQLSFPLPQGMPPIHLHPQHHQETDGSEQQVPKGALLVPIVGEAGRMGVLWSAWGGGSGSS